MTARKCDVCGKFYDCYRGSQVFQKSGSANGLHLIDKDSEDRSYSRKGYDLCQECMSKIWAFIESRGKPGGVGTSD